MDRPQEMWENSYVGGLFTKNKTGSKIRVKYRAKVKHRNSQIDKTKGKSIEQSIDKARVRTWKQLSGEYTAQNIVEH